jgi:hypothetical protein
LLLLLLLLLLLPAASDATSGRAEILRFPLRPDSRLQHVMPASPLALVL